MEIDKHLTRRKPAGHPATMAEPADQPGTRRHLDRAAEAHVRADQARQRAEEARDRLAAIRN
jgi:hypothetical protein